MRERWSHLERVTEEYTRRTINDAGRARDLARLAGGKPPGDPVARFLLDLVQYPCRRLGVFEHAGHQADVVGLGLVLLDADMRVLGANRLARQLLGADGGGVGGSLVAAGWGAVSRQQVQQACGVSPESVLEWVPAFDAQGSRYEICGRRLGNGVVMLVRPEAVAGDPPQAEADTGGSIGVLMTDGDGIVRAVDPAVTRALGYRRVDLVGMCASCLLEPRRCGDRSKERFALSPSTDAVARTGDVLVRCNDGSRRWMTLSVSRIEVGGEVTLMWTFGLANERERLGRLVVEGPRTGLVSKGTFHQRLFDEVGRARRQVYPLSLIVLDIDGFKRANDRPGHPVGAQLLAEVAVCLARATRHTDVLTRFGGEFAWVLPDCDLAGAHAAAERIRAAVAELSIADMGHVTVSLGVCDLTQARDASELLTRAYAALDSAKHCGRDRMGSYSFSLDVAIPGSPDRGGPPMSATPSAT